MLKSRRTRVVAVAISVALALALTGPILALAAVKTNYDWFKGHENATEYTIGTAGELKALASLVNGMGQYDKDGDGKVDSISAVSFEGKKITLSSGLPANFLGEAIDPIGTEEHPFQGSFDGSARQIDNFKLEIGTTSNQPVKNVGLFGYVGDHGSLTGVSVGPNSSIFIGRAASSADYVENVGMVAGFCAGTMTRCGNAGTLSVESAVVQQGKDDFIPVRNIGGVAGQCVFDMKDCANSGSINVKETSSVVAAYEHSQLVARVGGVVGLLGDESRVGTYDNHIYGEASKHGSIDGCTNTGAVSVDTPSLGGLDRFGVQTSAESAYIGGVVGYSQGSVTNCTNGQENSSFMGDDGQDVGYVRAENGNIVGGVCGSVRGVLADNTNIAWADDGADGKDPLVVSACTNYGDVYARVTAGGIVGKAGSYTTVTECLNSTKRDYFGSEIPTFVVATRWNKPGPGGIAGTANGTVSYCANFATIASAKWKDEAARTLLTQDGYYAAGIVGMLSYFDDQAVAHGFKATPISEVYSCYNAGEIVAGSGMRQRGIVGENDGYVYDNVLLEGMVSNDEIVYGDDASESEASGAVGENRVFKASELRGDEGAQAVAFMNKNSEANGWQRFWVVSRDSAPESLNSGYPLLNRQDQWVGAKTSLSDAVVGLASDAPYTGGESVPTATVAIASFSLTENADYRVVPQAGAISPSSGKRYQATIVGLGRYEGQAVQKLAYDVVAGDFSKCTLTVAAHTFDFNTQVPNSDDVVVRTPAGTVVPSEEYSYELVDEAGDNVSNPVNSGIYNVIAQPKAGSKLFYGEKAGTYRIKPASFMREVEFDNVKISYLGQNYPWVDSRDKGETDNPTTTLRYTGVAVKPTVGEITYKGHVLEEGKDYRVVYGNANSDDGYSGDQDANNLGKKGGRSIGCVTVRYINNADTNFTSYANMFFNIVDDGEKTDLALAKVEETENLVSDGEPIEPVVLKLNGAKLVEGIDYVIEYQNNVLPGTAKFRASGIGQFSGSKEGTFVIEEGTVYEFLFDYSGNGTDEKPYEATVTGVEYLSSRDSFQMIIPSHVEHDGNIFEVVAIGNSAFGGSSANDFSGSAQNTSKSKIDTVFVPASVRIIGDFAFGTSSAIIPQTSLSSIEFESGSKLQEIGQYAFGKCKDLASIVIPQGVKSIGNGAFADCASLGEMRFLTTTVDEPECSGKRVFDNCSSVVVRGYDNASLVKQIAKDNGGTTKGANGGKGFTFQALDSLTGAQISSISDQVYTGAAITPKVAVSVGGKRLSESNDYTLSYVDNVNAGAARVIVSGAGAYGGAVEQEFTILPADIGQASFTRVADQPYTGSAVALEAQLVYKGRALQEGVDYDLAYSNPSGLTIGAPFAAGQYRLVVTGKGNFTRQTYRAFSIVAPEINDDAIGAIGQQVFTGVGCEPDPTVTVAGNVLERDRDYTLSFENNVDVGQGRVIVYGIGSYTGQAQASFPIVAASLSDATVAGVRDVQATGSPVAFDPVVVVDGRRLALGADFSVSYADASGNALVAQSEEPYKAHGDDTSVEMRAVEGVATEAEIEASSPSAVGSYKLVITGVGNYAGSSKVVDFKITSSAPAAKKDISDARVTLGSSAFAYDATAKKPQVAVSLEGTTLKEGVDYALAYVNNVNAAPAGGANAPTAIVFGLGAYEGSARATFAINAVSIDASCVSGVDSQEYAAAAIRPHVVVVAGGRSLVEGIDYTLDYGTNMKPGANAGSVTVKCSSPNYTGQVSLGFDINKADVSGALVSLEYEQATYTGRALTPAVSVIHRGRALKQGSDYTVTYADNVDVGSAIVTIAGVGDYCAGKSSVAFAIIPQEVQRPEVNTGLVYTGSAMEGVRMSAGLEVVSGFASAADAGTYDVTVAPAAGYTWPGGFRAPVTLTYTIAPASLENAKVVLAKSSLPYSGKAQVPAVKSVSVGSAVAGAADYALQVKPSKKVGSYKATIVAVGGNFVGKKTVSYKIVAASQKLVAKAKSKSPFVKASTLKGKAQVLKLADIAKISGAKTKLSYAKAKGSSAKLKVNKKTGSITVAKGTKAGTYKLSLKVSAAGNANYKAATTIVKLTVKVK